MSNTFYTSFEMDWDHILLSYYENGKKKNERIKLKPYLFVPSALDKAEYETYDGKKAARVDFDSVKEAREFAKSYDGAGNYKIYGLPLFHYVYIYENFKDVSGFRREQLKILNYDIEVDTRDGYPDQKLANREINAVTMKLFGAKDIYVLGLHPYETKEEELLKLIDSGYKIHYKQCKDEKELIYAFYKIWERLNPDVVTGWNIRFFDIPYVIKRASYHFSQDFVYSLSPFKKVKTDVVMMFNKENDIFDIVGVPTLDYMDVYKKFSFGIEESYSLNYLSNKILNASKLDYSEYGSLAKLQVGNWNKYIDYNIIDVIRVEQIDEKVRYMDVAFEIAYETKTNYTDSMTTIRVWDVMIHNYLMDRKRVVPFSSDNRKERQIQGGYVKAPQIGKHRWVMSFDFKSLYPHLCMTYNISPDTYLGTFKPIAGLMSVEKILDGALDEHLDMFIKNNACITGCGTIFSKRKQGFVPAIMQHLFKLRAEHSKKEDQYTREYAEQGIAESGKLAQIYGTKSQAIKLILNGGYGALSNEFYRFFADQIAESFTLSGQLSIRTVERFINRRLNEYMDTTDVDYVLAIDTDSVYLTLETVVDKFCGDKDPVDFMEEFSETIQEWIQEGLEHLYKITNAYEKKLSMSLESIGPGIWVAKKRYVMSLPSFKKVRFNPPKIKIMGIEAVRSTTPQVIRKWITDAIPLALSGSDAEMKEYIDNRWEEFIKLPFSAIAMPKGTNDLEKYADKKSIYGPRTPMHVRGALLFNDYIKKKGWEKDVDVIRSGDKVKTMYLVIPNPLMENAISTPEELPNEFKEFNEYIDYEKQFDKTFLDPLKRITDAAGINLSSNISMDQFYV